MVITKVLKELGLDARLHVASDGENALMLWDKIEADPQTPCPCLVLLDLNLPRISGLEVLARIRSGTRCADLPVIIVTSSDAAEDRSAANALNATAYFKKPVQLSEYLSLGHVIRSVLPGGESSPPSPA